VSTPQPAYGQAHVIDLVCNPPGSHRPGLALWPVAHRPAEFPGFGQPVLAPAAGIPVRFQPANGGPASLPRTGQYLLAYKTADQTDGQGTQPA
jgi:hypothetical protein